MSQKKMYSVMELLAMGLPELPGTDENITRLAERQCWPFVVQSGVRGHGGTVKQYSIPDYVQAAIVKQQMTSVPALTDANTPALSDRQRKVAEARASVLVHIHHQAAHHGLEKAVQMIIGKAKAGGLPEHLQALLPVASQSGQLTRSTLYRWLSQFDLSRPNAVERLAPRSSGMTKRRNWQINNAPWAQVVLKEWQVPSKPSLAAVYTKLPGLLPPGVPMPSYDQMRRYVNQMGNVERHAGRMGSRDMKSLKPFVRRDTTDLRPADVYMADGHTFDAEVAHPSHGQPFRPEITSVIDAATRRVVGWSIDLAESGLAVLDALRCAVQTGGVSSIFYVDRGSGYRNAMISGAGTGLLARLGTELQHSIAYNSQARGIIERLHKTIWVQAAKELPTYIGASMDAQASNRVHKLVRRDVREWGKSRWLMPWLEFLTFAKRQVDRYNDRPHRSLPKVVDPATGQRRHQTPNEAWEQGVKDGALLVMLDPVELDQLFRPQREVRVMQGEVRLWNNRYFSHALTEFHGETVRIGYDIHDASRVWIYDLEGRFICHADFDGNKQAFFPENTLERAARGRAQARERRLQMRLDEVREELHGAPLVLENNPSPTLSIVTPHVREPAFVGRGAVDVGFQALPMADLPKRPAFALPSERYEWLKEQSSGNWTDADREWLREYVADPDGYALFAQRFDLLGLAWTDDDQAILNTAARARAVG